MTGPCSRVNYGEEGGALLLSEVLDHHLFVRRQRTGSAQDLLDRKLEATLIAVVRGVARHDSNYTADRGRNRPTDPVWSDARALGIVVSASISGASSSSSITWP